MATEFRFLSTEIVLAEHRKMLDLYGGTPGIRDATLLDAALAMPRATFDGQFLHRDVAEMAAAYLFHICQNHPFVDGNKRVALAAALLFLELNGHELQAEPQQLERLTLDTAAGKVTKTEIAEYFNKLLSG